MADIPEWNDDWWIHRISPESPWGFIYSLLSQLQNCGVLCWWRYTYQQTYFKVVNVYTMSLHNCLPCYSWQDQRPYWLDFNFFKYFNKLLFYCFVQTFNHPCRGCWKTAEFFRHIICCFSVDKPIFRRYRHLRRHLYHQQKRQSLVQNSLDRADTSFPSFRRIHLSSLRQQKADPCNAKKIQKQRIYPAG